MNTKEIDNLIDLLNEEERYKKAFDKQMQFLETDEPFLTAQYYPYLRTMACRLIEIRKQIDKDLEHISLGSCLSAQ